MYGDNAPMQEARGLSPGTLAVPTLLTRLQDERVRLTDRLEKVNRAIKALEASPEIAEAINAISVCGL